MNNTIVRTWTNIDKFIQVYEVQLVKAITEHPDQYCYPVANAPIVANRMKVAFLKRTYNKDGYAIKNTCKLLGIPYTYAGINEYIRGA